MTMTRRSRLCLIAAVILRDWGTMDVVGFVVVGEGRGGVWLTTSAVMSASARRGERREGSGTGTGACACRLDGGGSSVDAEEERRLIIVMAHVSEERVDDRIGEVT